MGDLRIKCHVFCVCFTHTKIYIKIKTDNKIKNKVNYNNRIDIQQDGMYFTDVSLSVIHKCCASNCWAHKCEYDHKTIRTLCQNNC